MINIQRLQQRLAVTADGILGPGTFSALFRHFGCADERSRELGLAAAVHFETYEIIDSAARLSHFMAQLAHESGGFRYMEEIASGSAYEGRKDLGNTEPGDGKRYKGRGPIQLTGRANYRSYGRVIGIDFERHPELVATPSIGLLVACRYWQINGLNALADLDDVEKITRRINGGLNGFEDRKKHLKRMKDLLA